MVVAERRIAPPLNAGLVVVAGGMLVLLARPWLLADDRAAVSPRLAVFLTLGLAGALWPLRRRDEPSRRTVWPALALGCAAFGVGRLLVGLPPVASGLALALALNAIAAIAEEVFFRRLVYGLLLPRGTGAAVAGSAALFAVAHVTVWGLWVLPLDLAAGLVLSWQRAATGRWSVPAVTHVVANTLALL
ncbi:MAG: CPBP family intramembrane metalloprotease [Actinobacteria bacterium]|nr:CPBP family intramembrane metalloprotease [Actinomycetota bacterium]